MRPEERAAWLRLSLGPLEPGAVLALLRQFGLPQTIFEPGERSRVRALLGPAAASRLFAEPGTLEREREQAVREWLARSDKHSLLTLADPDYPPALLQLTDAPPLLYLAGRRDLLALPAFAIVGSRHATRQGELNAAAFAAFLARAGCCVVSGMAQGIDAAAHRGALDSTGATLAVLGCGIDIVYPAANRALAQRLGSTGLLLSEYAPGTPAIDHQFPRRNRLIAALARGVLVVEAALRSGSLITARIAGELGREVCAVPGSIHSPLSRGCHRLLREGARLVESGADLLEGMGALPLPGGSMVAGTDQADGSGTQGADAALLAALGGDPVEADVLARRLDCGAGELAARLLQLELDGRVERLPGQRYQALSRPG
jgi:DNA processing protein